MIFLWPVLRAAASAQEAEPDPPSSAEEIEKLTLAILSRPEFQQTGGGSAGLWDVLRDFLADLLRPLAAAAGSEGLAWLVLALAILLAGWAVSLMLRETGRGEFFRLTAGKGGPSGTWRALDGAAASWEDAMAKARAALAAGRLYEAVWIAHRAFLGLLERRGALNFAKWKTNRDYLAECPAEHRAYPLFRTVSQTYEEVVYGHRPIPPRRLDELLRRMEEEEAVDE